MGTSKKRNIEDKRSKTKVNEKKVKKSRARHTNNDNLKTTGFSFLTKFLSFIVFCFCIYVLTMKKQTTKDVLTTESKVLFQYSEIIKGFISIQHKIDEALKDRKLADLIKLKLRPIQERVASLRTQTSQYENMGHISGGPTHFMTMTINELDRLNDQIIQLDMQIKAELKWTKLAVIKSGKEAIKSYYLIYDMANSKDVYFFYSLKNQNLDLLPISNTSVEESYEDSLPRDISVNNSSSLMNTGLTPFELAEKLESTGKLLEQREVLLKQIIYYYKQIGFETLDLQIPPELFKKAIELPGFTETLVNFNEVYQKIQNTINVNGKYLNLTAPWIHEATIIISSLLARVAMLDEEKHEPFIKLRNLIKTDIHNLKKRVENLQYSYQKPKPEPMITVAYIINFKQ